MKGTEARVTRGFDDVTVGSVLLAIAATALGIALQYSAGTLSSVGIGGLTLAYAATAASQAPWRDTFARRATAIGAVCIGLSVVMLFGDEALHLPGTSASISALQLALLASLAIAQIVLPQRWVMGCAAALGGIFLILGSWLIASPPMPGIDVLVFQRDASAALLQGISPYSLEFRDPYPPELSARYYGPGVSVNGVLKFGYPYMPLTLLLTVPGYVLGDVRYASLAAIAATAALIVAMRPSRVSALAAAILLTSPAFPTMLRNGWTDAYVAFFAVLICYCHVHKRALLPYVVGLFFATKQYLIVAAPLVLLLFDRPWRAAPVGRFLLRAGLTAAAVTVPFMAWDPNGFMQSVVVLQARQPFRHDALSYVALASPANPGAWLPVPFVLAFATSGWLACRSGARTVSFAAAVALTMLPFFAFNKQAFLNYYFMVLMCLCGAMAANATQERPA